MRQNHFLEQRADSGTRFARRRFFGLPTGCDTLATGGLTGGVSPAAKFPFYQTFNYSSYEYLLV